VTHIVPVYEGYALPANIRRLDVAGRHMTEYLIKLLLLRGYTFNRSADYETVREMKEQVRHSVPPPCLQLGVLCPVCAASRAREFLFTRGRCATWGTTSSWRRSLRSRRPP